MKQVVTALLLIAAASVLAHLHVTAQTYYPVVRVSSPEGLVFTAVHEPTSERGACAAANERFLAPLKSMCSECRVVAARCERELEGAEAALSVGKSPHHRIFAPGVQVAIVGPDEAASLSCSQIERTGGAPGVRCVPPSRPVKS